MEVFRIAREEYAESITASGKAARWNKDNQYVVYTAQVRSLSTLELVVHKSFSGGLTYKVMVISVADEENLYKRLYLKDMPPGWRNTDAYPDLQDIGSEWYLKKQSLVLQVPSVIIPQEFNYIINLNHPDFSTNVSLIGNEEFYLDGRLL